jgi:hypothetical protein
MTLDTFDQQVLQRVCCGNTSAMDFLANHWQPYVHEVDDIIDGDRPKARDQLKTFARAVLVYTHPFFIEHMLALRQLALNITITFADSADWEKSPHAWQRDWANHNRHCGMEMVVAVALICGGHDHAFAISQEQRAICNHEHTDALTGKPN